MTMNRPSAGFRAGLLALTALTVWCAGAARAQTPTVSDIAVVGNANISREAILGVTSMRVGQPFSTDVATRDVSAIRDLGYFQRVAHREEDTSTGVRVIYDVVENPKITQINVTGNKLVPAAKITDIMTTKVGDVLNTVRFGKDLDKIQDYYSSTGYLALVDVDQNQYITPAGVLTVPIREVTIEGYRVTGNKKTKSYVILRELRTPIGQPFNRTVLVADINRLYNLQIVDPQTYRLEPGSAPDKVIVVVEVTEKKTGQVEVGAGYSSEQGLIGRLGISEPNFKGTGQGISASTEISGRYRTAGVPPISVDLSYTQPYLNNKRESLSVSLYDRTSYEFSSSPVGTSSNNGDAYEVRVGAAISLTRPLHGAYRLSYSLRDDNIRTYSPITDFSTADLNIDTKRTSNVASLGTSLAYDTRDTTLDPAHGVFTTFGVEVGHTRLGGDQLVFGSTADQATSGVFLKPAVDYRRYIGMRPRPDIKKAVPTLALRLKGGVATGPLSFFDQYFVGGADTMRGYSEDRFWGKKMVLANLEYRFPVADSLQLVLFFDAGDAWGSSLRGDPQRYANYVNWATHGGDINGDGIKDPPPPPYTIYDAYEYRLPQHDAFTLHDGYGFGIRVKTPIGPLRLDYGISKEGAHTHFSIAQTF